MFCLPFPLLCSPLPRLASERASRQTSRLDGSRTCALGAGRSRPIQSSALGRRQGERAEPSRAAQSANKSARSAERPGPAHSTPLGSARLGSAQPNPTQLNSHPSSQSLGALAATAGCAWACQCARATLLKSGPLLSPPILPLPSSPVHSSSSSSSNLAGHR